MLIITLTPHVIHNLIELEVLVAQAPEPVTHELKPVKSLIISGVSPLWTQMYEENVELSSVLFPLSLSELFMSLVLFTL